VVEILIHTKMGVRDLGSSRIAGTRSPEISEVADDSLAPVFPRTLLPAVQPD